MDLATLNRPAATRPLLLGSVAFAFFVALFEQYAPLFVPGTINNVDVLQHIYWMRRFQDPELFQNDLLTEFAASPFFAKRGLTFLYYVASYLVDPVTFSAVLPLILVPVTAAYLFRLGGLIKDNVTATSLVMVYLPTIWGLGTSGLQRDFALPLLVAFLYYVIRQRYVIVVGLLTLQGLFYPAVLLVSLGVFAACTVDLKAWRLRIDRRKAIYLALSLLLAFAVLVPDYLWYKNERIGPLVRRAQTLQMPEFHVGGRNTYFQTSWLDYLIGGSKLQHIGKSHLNRFLGLLYFTALAIAVTLWRGKRWHLPREIWALPLSAVGMFVVAHLLWPLFYYPSRYTERTIPLFLMIFVAANFLPAASVWAGFGQHKGLSPHSSSAPSLLFVAFLLGSYSIVIVGGRPTFNRCPFPELVQYLKTLPKDVLIAGHPLDMDWVPTCARRKVLVNQKLSHAFYLNYYREVRQRMFDFFDAYYANSPGTIRQFTEKYGILYLVVDETDFTREAITGMKRLYPFEPFRGYVSALIARNAPQGFAILDYPYGQVVWRSQRKVVIKVPRGASGGLRSDRPPP